MGMLLDAVQGQMKEAVEQAAFLTELRNVLKGMAGLPQEGCSGAQFLARLEDLARGRRKLLDSLQSANSLSEEDRRKHRNILGFLQDGHRDLRTRGIEGSQASYDFLKDCFSEKTAGTNEETRRIQARLHALFSFAEEAFGEGNEMLILLTELTGNSASARFIAAFGSPDYARLSEDMMLARRRDSLRERIAELDL